MIDRVSHERGPSVYELLGAAVATAICTLVVLVPIGHRAPLYLHNAARWRSIGVRLVGGAVVAFVILIAVPVGKAGGPVRVQYAAGFAYVIIATAASGLILQAGTERYARWKTGRTLKPSSVRWAGLASSFLSWSVTLVVVVTHTNEPVQSANASDGQAPTVDFLVKIFGIPAAVGTLVLSGFLIWASHLRRMGRYDDLPVGYQYPGGPAEHKTVRTGQPPREPVSGSAPVHDVHHD